MISGLAARGRGLIRDRIISSATEQRRRVNRPNGQRDPHRGRQSSQQCRPLAKASRISRASHKCHYPPRPHSILPIIYVMAQECCFRDIRYAFASYCLEESKRRSRKAEPPIEAVCINASLGAGELEARAMMLAREVDRRREQPLT
jgi:hypothetical protein